jgi:cation:H+ antiporter
VSLDLLLLTAGAMLLYFGGEWLVRGAAGLARSFHVRPLMVGLTVVAFGTSAPEGAVSVSAAVGGRSEIALGNVVGSCVANLGLILGSVALLRPPRVDASLIRRDVPVLVGSALLVPLLLADGEIDRVEAAGLLFAAFVYVGLSVRSTRSRADEAAREIEAGAEAAGAPDPRGRGALAFVTFVGFAALVVGGECLVRGAVGVARGLGVAERTIGLTVVALGTSLPELAASAVAAARGHGEIAVGNVVGSNIFNVLLVLGGAAAVRPLDTDPAAQVPGLAALVVLSLASVFVLRSARRITRWEGALLLAAYAAFLVIVASRE